MKLDRNSNVVQFCVEGMNPEAVGNKTTLSFAGSLDDVGLGKMIKTGIMNGLARVE